MKIIDKVKEVKLQEIKIDIVVLNLIIFVISFLVSKKFYKNNIFGIEDKYKEFILGDTIYSIYNKDVDIKVIFIFIFIFLGLLFLASKIFVIKYWENKKVKKLEHKFLILIGFPFIQYFANPIFKQFNYDYLYAYLTYSYLVFIWLYREKYAKAIKILNIILFSYLSAEVLKYVFLSYLDFSILTKYIFILLTVVSLAFYKNIGLLLSQIFLPFYFIKLIENNSLYRGEIVTILNLGNNKLLAGVLIVFSLAYSLYEFKKKKEGILLSTVFVIFMILYWKNVPMNYLVDEYHYGELYTAYDQIYVHGNRLYSEYIPVKGYFHIIVGWINNIFYGGYTGLQKASILTECLSKISLISVMSLFMLKELILLFVFLNLFPALGNYFLIIPILAFLCQPKILNRSWNFVIGYLYLNFIYFMYYQSFGIALAICLLPNFIYSLYKIIKNKEKPSKYNFICLIFGLLLAIYNLKNIYYGLKYLLLNASSNLYYWGNSSGYTFEKSDVFFIKMITKNIWIGVSIVLTIYLIKNFRVLSKKEKIMYFVVIFYPIVINSYLLGRHDGGLARTGKFSIMLIQLLTILCVYLVENLKKDSLIAFILIGILFSYNLDKRGIFSFKYFKIPSVKVVHKIPNELERGVNSKLKKLGEGFISKDRLNDLETESELIEEVINKKENSTFLIIDEYLTQSARYSLFDRKIPTLSHSMLNIPSLRSQKMELERFKTFNVPIIRISSGINRYLLFYKTILQRDYVYTLFNKREYLIEREAFERIKNKYSLKEEKLPGYLYQKDFKVLPIKWGNSYKNNKENLQKIKNNLQYINTNHMIAEKNKNTYKVINPKDPFIIYNTSEKFNGNDIDFIKFNIKTKHKNNFRMQIFWANKIENFTERKSVVLTSRNGSLVIPIVKNLDWLKDTNINKVRFDFIDLPSGTEVVLDEIEFLKYNID